jgi:uncharacterized protein
MAATAQDLPAQPAEYVVDLAGILSASKEQQLNGSLRELEQKTGAQFIVLLVQTTNGEPIESFSLKTAERWQLGRRGKDDGLLLVIAIKDRKYRFEVAYGLEGLLPDGYVGRIGRDVMAPHFRSGNYNRGVSEAVLTVANRIAEDRGVTIGGLPKRPTTAGKQRSGGGASPVCAILAVLLFVALLSGALSSRRRHYRSGSSGGSALPWLILGSLMSSHSRRSWGGGGWSGGGWGSSGGFGGGFGGGGGGSFGGGGASGGW